MRANKGNIKTNDSGGGRVSIEMTKEKAENFASFTTDRRDVGRPVKRG